MDKVQRWEPAMYEFAAPDEMVTEVDGDYVKFTDYEAIRAQLAAAEAERDRAVKRLLWVGKEWGEDRRDYAMHVLRRGGTGDLSDICSFIDAAIATHAGGGVDHG